MTDTGSTRVVEVFCACTQRPDPCPRAAVLPADAEGRRDTPGPHHVPETTYERQDQL